MSEDTGRRKVQGLVAGALYGGLVTGALGMVLAVAAFLSGDTIGAGICVLGSAVAFGLVANACLRE